MNDAGSTLAETLERGPERRGRVHRDLTPLMRPSSIAVIGASVREVRANRVIRTLRAVGYTGQIWPINPNYEEVLDLRCYPDLASTPSPADCAVIAIPAAKAVDVLELGAAAGVRSAIVLAAGFGESGEAGRALQARLEALAADRGLVICGPNCFGIVNVVDRIAPFIGVIPIPLVAGGIGLASQSGGLTNVIVPPLMARGIGFSHVVSCGNQAGATLEDYLDFFVDDDATTVIAAFVEGFRQPAFLADIAARAHDRGKPIVVLKVGQSELGRSTALAHTASVVGSAKVTEAVFRQLGIVHVASLEELIETLALLAVAGVRPSDAGRSVDGTRAMVPSFAGAGWGDRLGVITGTGGLMAYLGDVAAEVGIRLPALDEETRERLQTVLPEFVGAANPLDGTGAMYEDVGLFPSMLEGLAGSPVLDVLGVHLDFNPPNEDRRDASRQQFVPDIVRVAPALEKPVVVFTARSGSLPEIEVSQDLRAAGVPLLDGVGPTLRAIRNAAWLAGWLAARGRHAGDGVPHDAGSVPARAPAGGRMTAGSTGLDPGRLAALPPGWLDSTAAFELVAGSGIAVPARQLVTDADAAVRAAEQVGYPVVLKVESPSLQHKADVGGVLLALADAAAVRDGFHTILRQVRSAAPDAPIAGVVVEQMAGAGVEVLLGVKRDEVFGPVVAVGLGGVFVEILDDIAVGVPPLSDADVREMLRRLRSWPLLEGARGAEPADIDALVAATRALGDLALALGERVEAIDVNPLVVFPPGQGCLAVDALVRLR